MQIPHEAVLLRIFIGESDRWEHKPLYEAIVLKAREVHLAGATVLRGPMGFGKSSRLHTAKILRLSMDLPLVIEIVDSEEKINAFLPDARPDDRRRPRDAGKGEGDRVSRRKIGLANRPAQRGRSKIELSAALVSRQALRSMQQVNLGMIGGGTVGSGVFHALQHNGDLMASRLGVKIAVPQDRREGVRRTAPLPDPALADDDRLAGGRQRSADPRRHRTRRRHRHRQDDDPRRAQARANRSSPPTRRCSPRTARSCSPPPRRTARIFITKPASAAASRSSSRCAKVSSATASPHIYGIVNGTCNYILTRMKLEGADFADVLADAQKQGYAETPPDLDIDGHDAQHKIGILASLAHGFWVDHHADPRRRHPRRVEARHAIRAATRLHDQAAGHRQASRESRAEGRKRRRRAGFGLSDAHPERARAGQRERRVQRRASCAATWWATRCSTVAARARTPPPARC